MRWLIEPFTADLFMQRALLAGVLVAIGCAIAGTFMVLRGLAFLGDALSHGVLPGVAGALLLGLPGMLGAAVGAAAMIGGVQLITRRSRLGSDTAIGLLFVGMVGLGVVIVSRQRTFSGDVIGILFGEILGVSTADLVRQAIAVVVIAAIAVVFARPFLLVSFDPEQADVAGWPAKRVELLMLVMLTIAVIASFQTVGTLLVFGMLLAPAGTGAIIARRVSSMIAWACLFGVLAVYVGLLLSYHYDLSAGAMIVVVAVAVFFVVLFVHGAVLRRRTRSDAPSTPTPPNDSDLARLDEALPAAAEPDSPSAVGHGVVTAAQLAVGYPDRVVVEDVTINLAAGHSLAVVGVNGSGKSTLLKTIAGLLAARRGSLHVFGDAPGKSAARLGYMSQSHHGNSMLAVRASDVVMMARYRHRGLLGRLTAEDHRVVAESLARVRISDLADQPLRALSGGQQQRVYLAHVLARQADLLLLDEPTAALDVSATARYRELIAEELSRGAAVISATHDVADALRHDQVLLLAGRVVAAGAPRSVLTPERLLEAFGLAIVAVPHGDHTDLVVSHHAHDEHIGPPDHAHD